MEKLERIFKLIKRKNPNWSTYVCLAETIKGWNYKHKDIKKAFNLLVDKSDYKIGEKNQVLKYLYKLSWDKLEKI